MKKFGGITWFSSETEEDQLSPTEHRGRNIENLPKISRQSGGL